MKIIPAIIFWLCIASYITMDDAEVMLIYAIPAGLIYLLLNWALPTKEEIKAKELKDRLEKEKYERELVEKSIKEEALSREKKEREALEELNAASTRIEKDKIFEKTKKYLINNYDIDGDGFIDVIQSDDFQKVLDKNKDVIVRNEKDKVQSIIRLSNYLRKKRNNIQAIFDTIMRSEPVYVTDKYDIIDRAKKIRLEKNIELRNTLDYVKGEREFNDTHLNYMGDVLSKEIQAYNMLLFHSINMVVSVRDGDLFTFYEIYETLDKLNVFNSNWENEVSNKLSNIEMGLGELMVSIDRMNTEIVNEISSLNYYTQESFSNLEASVTNELQGVNSKLGYSNLLATVNTYQLHNISSNSKKLLKR